jgi:hypothetical protein
VPRPEAHSLPIVVGGCHRSGTSLVRRILDAHPRIYCGPEVKFFRDFYGTYLEDPIHHVRFATTARSMLPEHELLELFGTAFVEMHERAARHAGKPRWADKNPENVVFLAAWDRLLGDGWLFVHVVRNPLDTLASIKQWSFPVSIPAGLDARIDMYLEYLQAGLNFRAANPERCFTVLYEELVTQVEPSLRALMSWLGEDLDPGQTRIDDGRHQAGLEDPKIAKTSHVHHDSVGRWREVLSRAEAATIRRRTDGCWRRIDPDRRWQAPDPRSLSCS